MNPSKNALASPGRINGNETVQKVSQVFARKVCAASSIEGLMPSTTPISTRNAIGVKAMVCANQIPGKP
jgi:hypothetical protein